MAAQIHNHKGFTLLEIVVTLIIVSIMATIFSLGFSQGISGFMFTKQNAETVQQAQMVMTRLSKELIDLDNVTSSSATSMNFDEYRQSDTPESHSVSWQTGTNILRIDGEIVADILDPETGLDIAFLDADGVRLTGWGDNCRLIEITLNVLGANNIVSVFTTQIAPRNLNK